MQQKDHIYYQSPLGLLQITGTEDKIYSVQYGEEKPVNGNSNPCLRECVKQLDLYFQRKLREFSLPLELEGTPFEKKVWQALLDIPYAATVSYGEIAARIGDLKSVRAVGAANKHNRIAIIVPCHRVIGANKKLTGYAGGLWRKEWLIEHEQGIAYLF